MKTAVQQTSLWAYDSLKNLSARQKQVFDVIEFEGPISNYDIAEHLRWPINSVTGRTKELVEKGLVEEAYKDTHPITERTVIYWWAKQ